MKVWGGWLDDHAATTEAYAAYLNAPRNHLESEERLLFDEDTSRAKAAMERAWLESKPTKED